MYIVQADAEPPTLHLDMDRTRINQVGPDQRRCRANVLISLSGSSNGA